MKSSHLFLCVVCCLATALTDDFAAAEQPSVDGSLIFAEKEGLVAVEAEHFFKQTETDKRAFYLTHGTKTPNVQPDGDPNHSAGASGGGYLEILPDTRRTHGDKLIRGTNFSPQAGKMAVLHYKVNISTPGRYYVWVRADSTGSEDNGLHVGIDGTWPDSGQRLQWCEGKRTWRWDSKQRTEAEHCGEPGKIFLDIDQPGPHVITFSMREDGFEFDKWLMTTDHKFARPKGSGPASVVMQGKMPPAFAVVLAPAVAQANADDSVVVKAAQAKAPPQALKMPATMFADGKVDGYYVDQAKWLAINPDKSKKASASRTFPYPTGKYHVTLETVGENDGQSIYQVLIDDQSVGDYKNALAAATYQEGKRFHKTWENVAITDGAIITVQSQIGSADGKEYSRARWRAVAFTPADAEAKAAAQPFLKELAGAAKVKSVANRNGSPTKSVSNAPLQMPRGADGDGSVRVSGQTKLWHAVTLTLNGPYAHEKDNQPNPFTDLAMNVTFKHADGTSMVIPGYFATDGDAANTSAESGNQWRAHFAPDRIGPWTYQVSFKKGASAALDDQASAVALAPFDGQSGTFEVQASDKSGRDLRAQGRLDYVGKHYLQFAGSKKYFLKVGADAPETLLAFTDFDNTVAGNPKKAPLKTWAPHLGDWNTGDPTWGDGKGKGLIGAINYLSGKGCNAFSFLTYNAGGDGDNVWPFIDRDDKLHYDCSKLDQWGIVFEHGTQRGMYLHFKMQETENDDHNTGKNKRGFKPESLDGGNLGSQRRLYCRELIARFGHNLALNWNLGEENTQSTAQQKAMIDYIAAVDAYDHPIVVHTFPNQQDKVYRPLLGDGSQLTGTSLQNSSLQTTHEQTVKWVRESAKAGRPWVVAFDESGSAAHAQSPDLGYQGYDGRDRQGKMTHTQHDVRKQTLWGTLMAGGGGCEYYFGYQYVENDIVCQDWRSRDASWDYCRIAIAFFHDNEVPFWKMTNADELIGNPDHGIERFCLAKADDTYVVYLPSGGSCDLDLSTASGTFDVKWYNPRTGGELQTGGVTKIKGGSKTSVGQPPSEAGQDWVVLIRR